MSSAPPGPCTGITLASSLHGFLVGLVATFTLALLALVAYLLTIATRKIIRLLIQVINAKIRKHAGDVTAQWEASQVNAEINAAVSAPTKRPRL